MDPILYEDSLPSRRQRTKEVNPDNATIDMFATAPAVQSATSKESADAVDIKTVAKRRLQVHNIITAAGAEGVARFEISDRLGVPGQNWITSSVNALMRLGEIVELTRTHFNHESQRNCAVLIDKRFKNLQKKGAA